MRDELFLLGRILLSLVFIGSAIGHLTETEGSAEYASYKKVPNARLMVQLTGVCMALGGLALILGVFMDLAAFLLAVLVVVFAIVMHRFWEESDPQTLNVERAGFMKNISIAGGCLVVASFTTDSTPYTLTDALF